MTEENQPIQVICDECKAVNDIEIDSLIQDEPHFCSSCGRDLHLNTQELRDAVAKAHQSLDEILKPYFPQ